MKKIINYLISVLLFVPIFILADGAGPVFPTYSAYVSDSKGAYLYKYDDKYENLVKTSYQLKYNTNVDIIDEIQVNGKDYYGCLYYSPDENSTNEDDYYINLSKITIYKKEFTLEDLKKYEEEDDEGAVFTPDSKGLIVLVDGLKLYNGPSLKYSVQETKLNKFEEYEIKASTVGWHYIEKGNVKGWVADDEKSIALLEERKIWFLNETTVYDINDNKLDFTIPKDTKNNAVYSMVVEVKNSSNDLYYFILKYNDQYVKVNCQETVFAYLYDDESDLYYSVTDAKKYSDILSTEPSGEVPKKSFLEISMQVTVVTNGNYNFWYYGKIKGTNEYFWLNDNKEFAKKEYDSFIAVDDITLYDSINGEPQGLMQVNTVINDYFYYYDNSTGDNGKEFYYVKYKNNYYWINNDGFVTEISEEYGINTIEKELHLYDKPGGEKLDTVIPKNTKLWFKYDYYDINDKQWYYVVSDKYNGWVLDEDEELSDLKDKIEEFRNKDNEESNATNSDDNEPESVEVTKKNQMSNKEIVIIGALCAVVFALMIVVIIKLVNKKKNQPSLEEEKKKLKDEIEKVEKLQKEIEELEKESDELTEVESSKDDDEEGSEEIEESETEEESSEEEHEESNELEESETEEELAKEDDK